MRSSRRRRIPSVLLAWLAGFGIAGVYAAVRYVPAAGWVSNDVTTGASLGYPDLQPHEYDSSPENTTILAATVAARLSGWKVITTDPQRHTVVCEIAVPPGLLTDDLQIRVETAGSNGQSSRVVIRSHSRAGWADLGENTRHIRALQAGMDDRLPLLTP